MPEIKLNTPIYLGDGLYASWDGYQLEVYSFNGLEKTNVVYMDPGVQAALVRLFELISSPMREEICDEG